VQNWLVHGTFILLHKFLTEACSRVVKDKPTDYCNPSCACASSVIIIIVSMDTSLNVKILILLHEMYYLVFRDH
jgi:hypothetical protein